MSAEAATTGTTALARRGSLVAVTERARGQYDADQVSLIKHTIMPEGSNDGELALFLEVSARYQLDPFSGQIWPVKYKGKVRNVVGKDGWLQIADRRDDFRGCAPSDVVRAFDHFTKAVTPEGRVVIDHQYRDKDGQPTHGGDDGELRGPIVGGYAVTRREGHADTYFFAYRKRYDKGEHTWASHPDAMMQKVAEAMTLRKAYPLAGLYSEFEVPADRPVSNITRAGDAIPINFGDDEDLARSLQLAFETLAWKRAKVRTVMNGCETKEDREKVLRDLNIELDSQELPPEEEVTGVVVDDEPTAA